MTSRVEQSLSQLKGMDDRQEARTSRQQNHIRFRSNFQSIIEKYEHDFNEIGDEIDLRTLQVAVDNGHLQAMRNDKDPGVRNSRLLKNQHQDDQDSPKKNLINLLRSTHQDLPQTSSSISKSIAHCFSDGFDVGTENETNDIQNSRVLSASDRIVDNVTDQSSDHSSSPRIGSSGGKSEFCTPAPLPTLYPSSVEELGKSIALQISGFLKHCQIQSLIPTEEESFIYSNDPRMRNTPHSPSNLKENRIVSPLSSAPSCEPPEHNLALEQSIRNYDLHSGCPTPGHVLRSHFSKLSKEDELMIKLKYRDHMSWSEIKKYFPSAEKFATVRNRWYAQLSKRYPHDGRIKSQRSAMETRNRFSRATKRTYSAKIAHDKPLRDSTLASTTLPLNPHSSKDVQRNVDVPRMDERCSQYNQEHDDSFATCEQPEAVVKPSCMALMVNSHDFGVETINVHRTSHGCSLDVAKALNKDTAYKTQKYVFQDKKASRFRRKVPPVVENHNVREKIIGSKSAIQIRDSIRRFPTTTASSTANPAKQTINLRQKHGVLAYEDSEDELAL